MTLRYNIYNNSGYQDRLDNFSSFPSPHEPDPRSKVICLQGVSTCSTQSTTKEHETKKNTRDSGMVGVGTQDAAVGPAVCAGPGQRVDCAQ